MIVIHSDVVRKLDMPIVVINEAVGLAMAERIAAIDHEPVFFGKLGQRHRLLRLRRARAITSWSRRVSACSW